MVSDNIHFQLNGKRALSNSLLDEKGLVNEFVNGTTDSSSVSPDIYINDIKALIIHNVQLPPMLSNGYTLNCIVF